MNVGCACDIYGGRALAREAGGSDLTEGRGLVTEGSQHQKAGLFCWFLEETGIYGR